LTRFRGVAYPVRSKEPEKSKNLLVTGMPRYYFHLVNGKRQFPDPVGIDLSDLDAARTQARLTIRAVFSGPASNYDWSAWWVSICNAEGRELASEPVKEKPLPR
jgi:hypothetical protein